MKYHKRFVNGVNTFSSWLKQLPESCSLVVEKGVRPGTAQRLRPPALLPLYRVVCFFLCYIIFSLPSPPLTSILVSLTLFISSLTGPMAMFGQGSKSQGLW